MAQKSTHSSDLSLTRDFQDFLRSLWKDIETDDGKQEQKRDWSIYLKSPAPDWSGNLWKDLR